MNVKNFRLVCKIASFILQLIAVFSFSILIIGVIVVFIFNIDGSSFTFEPNYTPSLVSASGPLSDTHIERAAVFVVPPFLIFFSYISYKGSQLFTELYEGQTPFSIDFSKSLKKISLLLILLDVLSPIIYSIVLTLLIENGHYITFGLSSTFLIGLILYVMSEILQYGIQLQTLADDTI